MSQVVPGGAPDRRRVMQLMAASLALAGAGCSPGQFGAPLYSRPRAHSAWAEGMPVTYATSLELGGVGRGVLVETTGGRPVKIEGNPQHPTSLGATDIFMQAEVLGLYDPARSRQPTESDRPASWEQARAMLSALAAALAASQGRGLHIVAPPVTSPTIARLLDGLRARLPAARIHLHEAIGDENAQAGAVAAFGRVVRVVPDLSAADTILSLGDDFLGAGPLQPVLAAGFEARRRRGRETGRMPRLVVAQATPGLAGARADLRLALAPPEIELLAHAVAAELGIGQRPRSTPLATLARSIAAELTATDSAALVLAGRDQPAGVHALAHAINARTGVVDRTVRYLEPAVPPPTGAEPLTELAAALRAGRVTHLVVLDSNVAYHAPADLEFVELLPRVPHSAHLGCHVDETARLCRWHLPRLHALETWGDTTAHDGTVGLQQPATRPLAAGLTSAELIALVSGMPADGMNLVQGTWRERWGAAFEERWLATLEAGIAAGSQSRPAEVQVRSGWAPPDASDAPAPGLTVQFAPDPSMWSGEFATNAWLQELPKPLAKQVWGNAAYFAQESADALGLRDGDLVRITKGSRSLEAPVLVLPGQSPGTITLPLGYGRRSAGAVGTGVGFDAYRLRTAPAPWFLRNAAITRTDRRQPVITTQHHHVMEGRDIVRFVEPGGPAASAPGTQAGAPPSLYPEHTYTGHAWAMTIDLDACIGCNACVIACQAENNVPVVGPAEVAQGREMHWLRLDRYYAGPHGSASTHTTCFQPVPCMHCEKAPCEVVCPVNATVHSSEGLNDMVYNRCIGTRTCSNNCPYKVRRFNWFDYAAREPGQAGASLNPEVTTRPLGVMEKCTYCTQRISAARIAARIERRPIQDGEILTACQQACPTRAITFGDVNDPASAVHRHRRDPRNYALLGELNTRPRTSYLARMLPQPGQADGS